MMCLNIIGHRHGNAKMPREAAPLDIASPTPPSSAVAAGGIARVAPPPIFDDDRHRCRFGAIQRVASRDEYKCRQACWR